MSSSHSIRIIFIALALLLALTTPVLMRKAYPQTTTQTPAAPPFYSVRETHIKLGMGREYQEFIKNEMMPAQRKGGLKESSAWTTANFADSGVYINVRPIESLKQFDEQPNLLVKGVGEKAAQALTDKWLSMVASTRMYVLQPRLDLSLLPKTNEEPKLALVVTHKIALGRTAEFESLVKNDVLPLFTKAGVTKGIFMGKVALGGDTNEYISLNRVDSFEDIQKWGAAIQAQGYASKISPKEAGIVLHRETAVYRYVPELSIRPEAQKAENK